MNQEHYETLTAKIATAHAAVSEVQKMAYETAGYRLTRQKAARALRAVEELLEALDDDWFKDERDLDEEVAVVLGGWKP